MARLEKRARQNRPEDSKPDGWPSPRPSRTRDIYRVPHRDGVDRIHDYARRDWHLPPRALSAASQGDLERKPHHARPRLLLQRAGIHVATGAILDQAGIAMPQRSPLHAAPPPLPRGRFRAWSLYFYIASLATSPSLHRRPSLHHRLLLRVRGVRSRAIIMALRRRIPRIPACWSVRPSLLSTTTTTPCASRRLVS